MANIKVDHKKFEQAAGAIEAYVSKHKSNMNAIENAVNSLGTCWHGADYAQFQREWQEIKGTGSTSDKMIRSLEQYADFLRFAANKYRSAQENAVNRADRLPKY